MRHIKDRLGGIQSRRSIFFQFFLYILIPPCILAISIFLLSEVYEKREIENTIKNSYDAFEMLSTSLNESLYSAYNTVSMLSISEDVVKVLHDYSEDGNTDQMRRYACISALKRCRAANNLFSNVFILCQEQDVVIGCDGAMTSEFFFNEHYVFEEYAHEEWMELHFKVGEARALLPSAVKQRSTERMVIPLV